MEEFDSSVPLTVPRLRKKNKVLMQKWYEPYVFLGPAVLVLLFVTVYPLFYSFFMSFHQAYLSKMHLGIPFVGVANYRQALVDPLFRTSLKNTLVFSLSGVSLEFVFGFIAAVTVHQVLKWMSSILRIVFLLPMIIAPVVVALIWRFMYNGDFGIINYFLTVFSIAPQAWLSKVSWAMPAIIAMDVWEWTPFMFLILLAGLQALPESPYEAALMDGARQGQIFRHITLPLLRPIILICLLLRVVDSIKTFDNVFVLTAGGPGSSTELASLYVYRIGFRHFNIGYGSALSYVLLIAVILLSKLLISRLRSKRET
jgi:multiple sugar transport system permease protein